MKKIFRISIGFGRFGDNPLLGFSNNVHDRLYLIPVFLTDPLPPVAAAILLAAINDLVKWRGLQATGGPSATISKNKSRAALIEILKVLANYVEGNCGSLEVLLDSGFQPTAAGSGSRGPLAKASIKIIKLGESGQALVTLNADRHAGSYQVVWAEIDDAGLIGPFGLPVVRTSSRDIPIDGLIPGKRYAFRGRAVGGSTHYSDWSETQMQRVL